MPKPIQDTIEFVLIEEETVVNDTVKVTANLVGMIPQDSTEADLRNSIRTLLRNFIDIEWQFSNLVRTGDPSGQERITLTATTRIPESENRALDRRREDASKQDAQLSIRIISATTDTSPTQAQIDQTQRNLRLTLLKRAKEEAKTINQALGETLYRLGAVTLGPKLDPNVRGGQFAASNVATQAYGSGFDEAGSLGNAVKIAMQANVQLRISR
jgi:hypothetical protein